MAAAVRFSSRRDLNTVSSTVPITYNSGYGSDEDYISSTFSQSLTSESEILSSQASAHDSFAFINSGYYSPSGVRRSQVKPMMANSEESEGDDKENRTDRATGEIDSVRSELQASHSIIVKHIKPVDNMHKLNIPLFMRHQVRVKLERAKSSSTEMILDKDNRSNSEEAAGATTVDVDNNNVKRMYLSTTDVSQKRRGYFQKFSALFRRNPSKSLNYLASKSNEDLTSLDAAKLNEAGLCKSRSQSYISDSTTGIISTERSLGLDTIKTVRESEREAEASEENMTKSSPDVKVVVDHVKDVEKCEISSDSAENLMQTRTYVTTYKPERTYSLIKRESEENNSSYVNFTRIPSLRRRKLHLRLHHHFTMTHPPEENEDIHVIKEATHIQPLDNGEAVVTDILANNMVLFGTDGNPKITFSFESGSEPWATCLTSEGCLAVTLKRQGCVSLWSGSGEPVFEFGHNVLSAPTGIQCDQLGRFVVADEQDNSVCIFSKEGELLTKLQASNVEADTEVHTPPRPRRSRFASPYIPQSFFKQPRYVCITNSRNYVIADSANHCIKIFDEDMQFQTQFGSYGRADGCLKFPYGVASDTDNNLYVADHFNNRVSLFSPQGEFIEHLLTSQNDIVRPKSLAVTQSFLYVTHGALRSNKVSVYTILK